MGRITELRLKNVRCFEDEQSAKLGRITLLVGENGAGKSTFLGCYKALAKMANFIDLEDSNHFDEETFQMGSFDTIVRSGKLNFELGAGFEEHCHTDIAFTFVSGNDAIPLEKEIRLSFNATDGKRKTLEIERLCRPHRSDILRFKESNFRFDLDHSEISYSLIAAWLSKSVRRGTFPFHGEPGEFRRRSHLRKSSRDDVEFAKFVSFFRSELPLPRSRSFAVESPDPSPSLSRQRFYQSLPDYLDPAYDADRDYLAEIGKELKLWNEIYHRKTPDKSTLEVMVKTPNGQHNLVDVGYGVYSLLPVLHAIQKNEPGTVFLLQQPEVHVHPSAHAELARIMAESNREFLIETHSDHFMDRFRICVMEGKLNPEEFSVLYFDRSSDGKSSRIYNIGIDKNGNLLNVPDGYREFFLKETRRLLGF